MTPVEATSIWSRAPHDAKRSATPFEGVLHADAPVRAFAHPLLTMTARHAVRPRGSPWDTVTGAACARREHGGGRGRSRRPRQVEPAPGLDADLFVRQP
jgi:hypothetical protein